MDESKRELVFRWEGKTGEGLISMRFSKDFVSFDGTWGNLDSVDDGGTWSGDTNEVLVDKARCEDCEGEHKETNNFFLYCWGPYEEEPTQKPLGSIATSDEICELLTEKFFSHPTEDYQIFNVPYTRSKTLAQWPGVHSGAAWIAQKTEGLTLMGGVFKLRHDTAELANKNLSDCLARLVNSNTTVYQVLANYFLLYL